MMEVPRAGLGCNSATRLCLDKGSADSAGYWDKAEMMLGWEWNSSSFFHESSPVNTAGI